MDTYEEHDELSGDDDPGAMADGLTYRDRARVNLDQIARDAKRLLAENGIEISLFFMIPNSGHSVLTFGTPADPTDDLWNKVTEIVSAIVRQSIGLAQIICRNLQCVDTLASAPAPTQISTHREAREPQHAIP